MHTIPFGQVQAVTTFSPDRSVVKFNLPIEPIADIEAFGGAEIRFAAPNVTVQLTSVSAA